MKKLRFAVLASGRGSNLQAILDACKAGTIHGEVVVVLSDHKDAFALERARRANIPAFWVNPADFSDKAQFEEGLLRIIAEFNVDYIILAGFMRIFSPTFIHGAQVPILNIHPSLLPAFAGLHAQRQAVEYGVRYSGCTVHFLDEGVDTGPIIMQAVVPVYQDDTEDSLAERILREEHRIYPKVLQLLAEGRVSCQGRKVIIAGEEERQ
ncbi:MAG TPA: phosphoribosylglycinamide formyltransferase [Peptococcaceae bacterium]|jgi:phosphoribosylglycinamide formyltransferase-1|nr:phosphoribosylglycinamide formyltransferase [Clostridia bacterium]HOB82369.1 phosphoribosylglycinamide formyltransferase [Peptococcaceae bacterium]HPZ71024.1 phosphoribosylglycinamide formyltransferase [Peptococcaceae bacterium]HQD54325.1 phosphoribosylglycinamide formyltransferase [Peptococcaceae bacterium]